MMTTPDVLIRNEGTVWVFNPLTPAAREWFDENVESEPGSGWALRWLWTTGWQQDWSSAFGMQDCRLAR